MTDHLPEHHPNSDAQWGFQKGKYTLTAHDWLKKLDENAVYYYFQKTLDDVPHIRIMEKLKQLFCISDCDQAVQLPYKASTKCCNQWSIFCCTPGLGFRAVTPIMTAFLHLIFLKFLSIQMTCFSLKTSLQAGFCQTAGNIDQIYDWSTSKLMKTNCNCKQSTHVRSLQNVNVPVIRPSITF